MTAGVYIKQNGVLVPAATVPGPSGSQGPTGPTGVKGDKGDPGGFVVSTGVSDSVNTNLNNITSPGLYLISAAASRAANSNTPVGQGGHLEVLNSGSYIMQRYTTLTTTPPNTHIESVTWVRVNKWDALTTWLPWRVQTNGVVGGGDLTGTGMPNSVITAPVGTYYTDTAGTNGAWRWLKKSGTGNTGWGVVHGDTGWRNLTAQLPATTSVLDSGRPCVRRVGDAIFLEVSVTTDASYVSGTTLCTLTPGLLRTGKDVYLNDGYGNASSFYIDGNGMVKGFWNGAAGKRGAWSYATSDPWPTTLPGTAV